MCASPRSREDISARSATRPATTPSSQPVPSGAPVLPTSGPPPALRATSPASGEDLECTAPSHAIRHHTWRRRTDHSDNSSQPVPSARHFHPAWPGDCRALANPRRLSDPILPTSGPPPALRATSPASGEDIDLTRHFIPARPTRAPLIQRALVATNAPLSGFLP
jgi:hypothetical protein